MKRKSTSLIILVILVLAISSIVNAYTLNGRYFTNTYISYTWGSTLQSTSNFIRQGAEGAINHMNVIQSHLSYSHNPYSTNTVDALPIISTTSWGYALWWPSASSGPVDRFEIKINSAHPDLDTTFEAQSVMLHELLHPAGLGHSSANAIMNTSRNRRSLYTLTSDDKAGLDAIY